MSAVDTLVINFKDFEIVSLLESLGITTTEQQGALKKDEKEMLVAMLRIKKIKDKLPKEVAKLDASLLAARKITSETKITELEAEAALKEVIKALEQISQAQIEFEKEKGVCYQIEKVRSEKKVKRSIE